MAKLSARHRTELVRVYKETHRAAAQAHESFTAVYRRNEYVLMSDSHILSKLTCIWEDGKRKSWPYHDCGKTLMTPEVFEQDMLNKGYRRTK